MQKSERRVTGLREKVLRIHSTCARVKVKTIQLIPGKDNNSERYRALSCHIVPYRAISCRIVRYRTSRKKNVVPLHQS